MRQLGLEMFSYVITKTCWDRPFKSRDSWCAGAASNSWWVTSSCSPRLAGSTQLGALGRCDADLLEDSEVNTLQRKSQLCIPFPGIVQPQSQFSLWCVCERFIYSQDRSTYFLQQNKQIDHQIIKTTHRHINVEIGTVARNSFFGNTCSEFSVLVLCSAVQIFYIYKDIYSWKLFAKREFMLWNVKDYCSKETRQELKVTIVFFFCRGKLMWTFSSEKSSDFGYINSTSSSQITWLFAYCSSSY